MIQKLKSWFKKKPMPQGKTIEDALFGERIEQSRVSEKERNTYFVPDGPPFPAIPDGPPYPVISLEDDEPDFVLEHPDAEQEKTEESQPMLEEQPPAPESVVPDETPLPAPDSFVAEQTPQDAIAEANRSLDLRSEEWLKHN